MQRINYFKILITMVIAILLMFAVFKVYSDRKETVKLQRILQHVEHSLRCYRSLEADVAVSDAPENGGESDSSSAQYITEAKDCAGEPGVDDSDEMLEIVGNFLEKIILLKNPPKDEIEKNENDADEDNGFHNKDVEVQLGRFIKSLPFSRLWLSEFSTTAYDSLTASGIIYSISSHSAIERLTELKLAQEHLELLEHTFVGTVTNELQSSLQRYDSCRSNKSESDDNDSLGCNTILIEQNFISTIKSLENLMVRTIAVKRKMEQSRQDAIATIKSNYID